MNRMPGFLFLALLIGMTMGCSSNDSGSSDGVDLGSAGGFVILAKAGVDTAPTSAVTGNVGVSPAKSTYLTGFALNLPAGSAFSTSSQVTGKVYAPDYAEPSPTDLTKAVGDMETAYTDAAGRAAGVTELKAGDLSGLTLAPDVYKWDTGVLINTDVTLQGSARDVWVFQIAGDLTMAGSAKVILSGGALPENVTWQVAGGSGVSLGAGAQFSGIILAKTQINLLAGASVKGRLFAQTTVNIISGTVTAP